MYACIDLGSNSFHLLIAEWQDGKSQIVERFSHIVQLGEGVAITGEISPAAFSVNVRAMFSVSQSVNRPQPNEPGCCGRRVSPSPTKSNKPHLLS